MLFLLSVKESTYKTRKRNLFQKLFLFSRKLNLRFLNLQVSRRHQMLKNKTRNTFHWITWRVNTVFWWNLVSFCHITKEKKLSKNSTKAAAWKQVPYPFVLAKNQVLLENEVFEASYKYLICFSKTIKVLPKSVRRPPQISFDRKFFENQKASGTSSKTIFFIEAFYKKFSFIMLHKLAKLYHHTVLTSQVMQ